MHYSFSIHCLNLATKIKDPTRILVKPAIIKEIPNSFFPRLQAETKNPTNAKIAPKTHVSKAPTNWQFVVAFHKVSDISIN
jgi:hypothetical protein